MPRREEIGQVESEGKEKKNIGERVERKRKWGKKKRISLIGGNEKHEKCEKEWVEWLSWRPYREKRNAITRREEIDAIVNMSPDVVYIIKYIVIKNMEIYIKNKMVVNK